MRTQQHIGIRGIQIERLALVHQGMHPGRIRQPGRTVGHVNVRRCGTHAGSPPAPQKSMTITLIVLAASKGCRVRTFSSASSLIATSRIRRSLKMTTRGAARRTPREHGASRPQWVKSATPARPQHTPHRRQLLFIFVLFLLFLSQSTSRARHPGRESDSTIAHVQSRGGSTRR